MLFHTSNVSLANYDNNSISLIFTSSFPDQVFAKIKIETLIKNTLFLYFNKIKVQTPKNQINRGFSPPHIRLSFSSMYVDTVNIDELKKLHHSP